MAESLAKSISLRDEQRRYEEAMRAKEDAEKQKAEDAKRLQFNNILDLILNGVPTQQHQIPTYLGDTSERTNPDEKPIQLRISPDEKAVAQLIGSLPLSSQGEMKSLYEMAKPKEIKPHIVGMGDEEAPYILKYNPNTGELIGATENPIYSPAVIEETFEPAASFKELKNKGFGDNYLVQVTKKTKNGKVVSQTLGQPFKKSAEGGSDRSGGSEDGVKTFWKELS